MISSLRKFGLPAIAIVCVTFAVSYNLRSLGGRPSDEAEKEMRQAGFDSASQYQEIEAILSKGKTGSLSGGEEKLLRELLSRGKRPREMAVMALMNLQGSELQSRFLKDVEILILTEPERPRTRWILVEWQKRDGAASIQALRNSKTPGVADTVRRLLATPEPSPEKPASASAPG